MSCNLAEIYVELSSTIQSIPICLIYKNLKALCTFNSELLKILICYFGSKTAKGERLPLLGESIIYEAFVPWCA